MDTVLADLKWHTCLVYHDDVIFARSFKEHLVRLESVLEAIQTSGLTLKREKCCFGYQEPKFFGHVISADGVLPDPAKTSAIANFPRTKDKKGARRSLGLCAYYQRFVKNFAKISEPLNCLT